MHAKSNRRTFVKQSALVGSGLMLAGGGASAHGQALQSDIFEVIRKRRSVRKFRPTPVPADHVTKILEAGSFAPTPRNRQAWKFVVVTDRAKINNLRDECIAAIGEQSKQYFTDYMSAPVYIVILADGKTQNPGNDLLSGALAAGYMFLAARALGYGTVFCRNSVPEPIARKVFNIPDDLQWVCITPIGVPDEWPQTPPKKDVKELIVQNQF
ncbi:MAG: nitroreductase family protein [Sedimentisphaerales bacterium]|jgi:nitroreductase